MALNQYSFGAGRLYMIPQGVAVPQPVQVGTCQDISLDLSWSSKELQGREDAAAAIGRGALKISGKIKAAKFRINDIGPIIFGATPATGTTQTSDNEGGPTGTVIPTPVTINTATTATNSGSAILTFTSTTGVVVGQSITGTNVPSGATVSSLTTTTVTMSTNATATISIGTAITFGPSITVANATTFVNDLGIIYAATGIQLSRVASAPTTGQYAVSAGVYTFATADAGLYVLPSYSFTKTAAGSSFTYYATQMGYRPIFQMQLSNPYRSNNPNYSGQPLGAYLYCVGIDKFSLDFKNEDWTVPETDFSASQDFLGRVITWGGDNA